MIKILTIIKKNLLILLNSKISSLILILGPIFLILIVGSGLSSTGLKDIQTEIYISEQSEFTDNFMENLRQRSFQISESTSLDECVNKVKNSNKNLCIELKKSDFELPEDLNLDKEELEKSGIGYSLDLHVDFSRQRIVWGIINTVKGVVEDYSSNIRSGASIKLKNSMDNYANDINNKQVKLREIYWELDAIEKLLESSEGTLDERKISDVHRGMNNLYSVVKDLGEENIILVRFLTAKNALLELNLSDYNAKVSSWTLKIKTAKQEVETVNNQLEELELKMKDLGDLNMGYLLNPIPVSYQSVSDNLAIQAETASSEKQLGFLDYIFPSFLSFFILLVSIILSTTLIINERKSDAHIRNVLSKTNGVLFLIGNFLTVLLIVLIQSIILLSVASFFLSFSIFSFAMPLIFVLLLSISVFTALGMLIGYLFNSQETAIMAAISLSLLLIIFSPLISPLETMPKIFRIIFSNTPVVLLEDILRRILIFESGIFSNVVKLIVLFVSTIVISAGTVLTYYLTRFKEIK
jgi:ABC-type multidrug transport system permease subunit